MTRIRNPRSFSQHCCLKFDLAFGRKCGDVPWVCERHFTVLKTGIILSVRSDVKSRNALNLVRDSVRRETFILTLCCAA